MSWPAGSGAEDGLDAEALDRAVPPPPPARPLAVEFATAVVGIGGAFGLLEKLFNPLGSPTQLPLADPLYLALLGLDVVAIVAAILLRRGTTWIVAANVAAIYAFLHVVIPTPTGIIFSAIYLAVVVACFLARDWFEAMRDWRVARFEARLSR